ncbi:hypothetical protein B0A48_17597 [Cryoendolithus antarcticus]|uniref:C2H2-type domain-containing protein n=1 Tax=Cryoendolithus antarcticus TaxID=1507870 RepID=A0A1V8SBZ5_9PEZI|nr:hypothetical protein B0A48_17597 [Cryoendolithus antarcticus]
MDTSTRHSPSSPTSPSSFNSTPISTPPRTLADSPRYHPYNLDNNYYSDDFTKSQPSASDDFTQDLLFADDSDESGAFDLFTPRLDFTQGEYTMPSPPIEIRSASDSPRPQSALTSQLQQPHITIAQSNDRMQGAQSAEPRQRQESVNMLGARSIPTNGDARRPSYAAGSLMGGMSWGGMSMGSFIRDDLFMTGTSPLNMHHNGSFQNGSFHSSSYLPKMEANYMRDYVCCDIKLDSMHELLQHYEEAHAQQPTQTMGRTPRDQQYPSSRAANATSTAQAVQQQAHTSQSGTPQPQMQRPQPSFQPHASPLFNGQNHDQIAGFDNIDDMDMDDSTPAPQVQQPQGSQFQPQPQFGRQQPRAAPLNVNIANAFQGQGLNATTPTTPRTSQSNFTYPSNPTVSSVNTPTLATQAAANRFATPDSSAPGTPAELDMDYSQFGNMQLDYSHLMHGNNYDMNKSMINGGSGTIDDPAKRLLSKSGFGNKGFPTSALENTGDVAKRVRENELLNGLAGVGGFVGEEIKPFKCPVIGCEKAYKNQNGLKYHKQHGHQNQQLKENPDGSFSIVDPTTSIPYPGTVGMEKEKPYRCEVCGKRYKNLNGLKYHRQHSPPCNPELKLSPSGTPAVPSNVQGISVNVAGAGMTGSGIGF